MRSRPRFQEKLTITGLLVSFTTGWKTWLQDVYDALGGWNSTIKGSGSINFGNIPLGAELSGAIPVDGAGIGDRVSVHPMANVPGLIFTGIVTAPGVITIYAKNFSPDFIDPPLVNFNIIIFQN